MATTPSAPSIEHSLRIDREHPWPWLEAFTEAAQDFFNGRDDDTEALLRCVLAAPATVLFGKSGLGKTSLVQAGLAPRLRQRRLLPVLLRVDHNSSQPVSAQLLNRLNAAVDAAGLRWQGTPRPESGSSSPTAQLWEQLHDTGTTLVDADPLVDADRKRWTPVFVLDQFEEAFTLIDDGERRQRLFAELGNLIEGRIPPEVVQRLDAHDELLDRIDADLIGARYILSLREDYLADLEVWADRIPRLGPNRCRLLPMKPKQALDAVQKTGGQLVTLADAQRIVDFLGKQSQQGSASRQQGSASRQQWIEPALLSLICAGLNQHRLDKGQAQLDTGSLDEQGSKLLEDFYNKAFDALPEERRHHAEKFVEQQLITTDGTRRPFPREASEGAGLNPLDLITLTDMRLLRIDNTEVGDFIELVHDRLAQIAMERARQASERNEQAKLAQQQLEQERQRNQYQRTRLMVVMFIVILVIAAVGLWAKTEEANYAKAQGEFAEQQAALAQERARFAKEQEEIARAQKDRAEKQEAIAKEQANIAEQQANIAEKQRQIAEHERKNASTEAAKAKKEALHAQNAEKLADQRAREAHTSEMLADISAAAAKESEEKARREADKSSISEQKALAAKLVNESFKLLTTQAGGNYEVSAKVLLAAHQLRHQTDCNGTASLCDEMIANSPLAADELSPGFKWNANSSAIVNSISFNPNGLRYIASFSDNTVHLRFARTGQPVRDPLTGHTFAVHGIDWSANGTWFASGSKDSTIRIWNADGSPRSLPLKGHIGTITSVAISRDTTSTLIASAGFDKKVHLWDSSDLDNIKPIQFKKMLDEHGSTITRLAFSDKEKMLASADDLGTLALLSGIDAADPDRIQTYKINEAHKNGITALSWHESTLLTGGSDGLIKIWKAQSGKLALLYTSKSPAHPGGITDAVWSPDGRRLITAGLDRRVRIWEWQKTEKSLNAIGELATDQSEIIRHLAISPEGARLLLAGSKNISLWNIGGAKEYLPLIDNTDTSDQKENLLRQASQSTEYTRVLAHPDSGQKAGQKFAIAAGKNGQLQIWSFESGKSKWIASINAHVDPIYSLAFNHDGTQVASGSRDGTIKIWSWVQGNGSNSPTLQPAQSRVQAHERAVHSLAFSSDGNYLLSASEDRVLRVSDMRSKEAKWTDLPSNAHSAAIHSAVFNEDGTLMASAGRDGKVLLWFWDKQKGRPTGNIKLEVPGRATISQLVFIKSNQNTPENPAAPMLAAVTHQGTLLRWNLKNQVLLGLPIPIHNGPIYAVAVSHDGRRLASAGEDRVINIWDSFSGKRAGRQLAGHTKAVLGLDFARDGKIISVGQDKTVMAWDPTSKSNNYKWQTLLCGNLRTPLTKDEWSQFTLNSIIAQPADPCSTTKPLP